MNGLQRFLRAVSAGEAKSIRSLLRLGCGWHGLHRSSGCCECDMVAFYREMEQS